MLLKAFTVNAFPKARLRLTATPSYFQATSDSGQGQGKKGSLQLSPIKSIHNSALMVLTEPLFLSKMVIGSRYLTFLGDLGPYLGVPLAFLNLSLLQRAFQNKRKNDPTTSAAAATQNDINFDISVFLNFHSLMLSSAMIASPLINTLSENPIIIPSSIIISAACWSAARVCTNIGKEKVRGYAVTLSGAVSSYLLLKVLGYSMFVALGPNPFVQVLESKTVLIMIAATSVYFGKITTKGRKILKAQPPVPPHGIEVALSLVWKIWDRMRNLVATGIGRN